VRIHDRTAERIAVAVDRADDAAIAGAISDAAADFVDGARQTRLRDEHALPHDVEEFRLR
jgi:hypothetical protein